MPSPDGAPVSAGYSGTPLVQKLGIKTGMRVAFVGAPGHYRTLLGPLPDEVRVLQRLGQGMDFVHFFTASHAELCRRFPALKRALASDGTLWISWPKKASDLPKDLAESDVRRAGLDGGLVDVKICAVDADWSGLKFVYRLKDRPPKGQR